MATDFELLMHRDAEPQQIDEAVRAFDSLEAIEAELTVYNPNSTISRVNRTPSGMPTKVSALVFDILKRATLLSEMTEGAFDVTAGPLVDTWGFTTRSGKRPTEHDIALAIQSVGWQNLRMDDQQQTITFEKEGMRINLGAIGKGYALDRIAARLRATGISDFLLHGGNSSILASGNADRSNPDGWIIGLAHPTRHGARIGGIRLRDQALATSGSGKQFFHFQGKRYGHVIDPRTGLPTGDSLSLTVLAPDATSADAVATGLFVLGSAHATKFIKQYPQYKVIAAVAGTRQGDVSLQTFNYDEPFA